MRHRTRSVALPRVTAPLGLSGTSLAPSVSLEPVHTCAACSDACAVWCAGCGIPPAQHRAGGFPPGHRQAALVQLRARCHVRHGPRLLHRLRRRAVVCRRAGGGEIEFYQGLLPGGSSEEE
eukprot:scaffold142051_cov84-Phaeocystis_antarctica.AAC.2